MIRKLACLITGLLLLCQAKAQSYADIALEPGIRNENYSSPHSGLIPDPADTIQYNTPLSFCEGGNVVLTANNAPSGAVFQWKKDGSDIPGANQGTYTANSSGGYSVVVTHNGNDVTYTAVVVTVFSRPLPSFSFNNNNACSGTPIQFNSSVTSGTAPFTYAWDFGDGNTSADPNPSHSYNSLGCGTVTFTAKLIVTDANGCANTVTQTVTVKQKPDVQVSDPSFNPFSNCGNNPTAQNPNYTITLNNSSPNASCISSYSIDWGDGNVQNSISFPITHTYTVMGAFNIVVTATGANGCISTRTYVAVNQSNPAVGISGLGGTSQCAPYGFWFKVKEYQLNSPGTIYVWDFGDNTPKITWSGPITVDSIFHVFQNTSCGMPSNQFTVKVTAKNGCDSTTATVDNIKIFRKPDAIFTLPPSVCVNRPVSFTNTSTLAYNSNNCNTITQWQWDFGDGGTSTDMNPSYTYTSTGTYTVTLIAKGACGSDTTTRQICITAQPTASFDLDKNTGCTPLAVTATNTSSTIGSCGTTTYLWTVTYSATNCGTTSSWSFTNGSSASSLNPSFVFNNAGTYTIRLAVTNACGTVTTTKTVVVKQPPSVSLNSIPNACGPVTINPVATITNCGTSGLSYQWTFTGGTPASSTSENPGPVTFSGTGTQTVTLSVTNECGTTTVTRNFTISPLPGINAPANQVYCPGVATTAFNTAGSTPGTSYTWTNSNTLIGLAASGTGATIPSFTTTNSGSSAITGTITIRATAGTCTATTTFTITVQPRPPLPGVTTPVTYCQNATATPLNATALNGHVLNWYTAPTGGTPGNTAPTPSTSATGSVIYHVSQTNSTTGCEGPRAAITVNVNPSPVISSVSSTQPSSCNTSTGSITLNGLAPNTSYTVNYTRNGAPQSITRTSSSSGVITINLLGAGTYDNITVVLNGCPSNSMGPVVLADPNPPAAPVVTSNSPICAGATLNLAASTTSSGTATYSWTGPNGFTSSVQNPAISNASVLHSGTYFATVTISGCSSSGSVDVTVHPKPAKPQVTRPVQYCLNATATALQATAVPPNTLTWYENPALTNGSATPIIPQTTTAGTLLYYVTQTNSSGCASDTSIIPVTVYALISSNVIGRDTTLCSGNAPGTLTGQSNLAGGTGAYTYQWQVSADGGATWTDIAGATNSSYAPGALFASAKYRRVVNSGPCTQSISNEVTITIQGTLNNYDISASQTICSGTQPAVLNGQAPTGGSGSYTFQWQSSTDNSNWTDISGITTQDYQPSALTATTYYRRKVTSGACSAFSSVVTITVNPIPVMAAQQDLFYCNGANVPSVTFRSTPSNLVSYSWTNDNTATGLAASGTGNLPSFTAVNTANPKLPLTSHITVLPAYTFNNVACTGAPLNFAITVLPVVAVSPIPDTVVCTGTTIPAYTPVHDAVTVTGSSVSYSWIVNGAGISLTAGNGLQIPSYTTTNTGNTDLVATITVTPKYTYGNYTCNGTPVSYTVTVKPAAPNASAGPDAALCAATDYTMRALSTGSATGLWTQLGTPGATIVNPTSPVTQISGLQQGNTYTFVWTVTGFASCPPSTDTVRIVVSPQLVNNINTTVQTICMGQSVTISGPAATGGGGSYQYSWEQSTDGVNWNIIAGQTGPSLTYTPSQTVYVRRVVVSSPCTNASQQAQIIVQPPVSNNAITADQSICVNTAAALLQGSVPGGANGSFQYQWQESADGGVTWTDIPGATQQDYDPGVMTVSKKFRRNVATSLCTGPQSSNSNVVTITVNPDALAIFTQTVDTACAPFQINASVIRVQHHPNRNGTYHWYANGNFIGTGLNFPGYTITGSGDSVLIKMVAVSLHGCRNDSASHWFFTRIEPIPAFTLSDTVGCGPLTVQATNNTANLSLFNYIWNFGNGQTSSLAQPGPVTFQSNPTFGDTTYQVTLSAVSQCTTINLVKTVRVKSKPKALFTPNISGGCSPMTVVFNNNSRGLGNSYTWYFGDGSVPVTSNNTGSVTHTFYSAVQDTFYVKLVAVNECGADSLSYAIVISPNRIALDFAVNGNQLTGCGPFTVDFINNSSGASAFTWDFGDNNVISTTQNIDTVTHTYLLPGTYVVTLRATNGCSDTSSSETITVYPKPHASFTSAASACRGDSIQFTNNSSGATSYLWVFGDGNTSTLTNPKHAYATPGIYTVKLVTYRFNAPGSVCADSTFRQLQVVAGMPGTFTMSDTVGYCAPFTVTFTNFNRPSVTQAWNFGDGHTGTGDIVTHTYQAAGIYNVTLTATVPGGCVYTNARTVKVLGPAGSWSHTTGYLCNSRAANFQVLASNTDTIIYHFGDGQSLTSTSNTAFHVYANPGVYLPSVILKNTAGCSVPLAGIDTIRVDRVKAGFTQVQQRQCGITTVNFADTSHAFFGKRSVQWDFGDGNTGTGFNVTHAYYATGVYPVRLIVFSNSGCSDTVTRMVNVVVNNKPSAQIVSDTIVCTGYAVLFNSSIVSADNINVIQWNLSNGVTGTGPVFSYTFTQPGNYSIRLVAGTVNGCFDTISRNIRVNPTPSIVASNDLTLCRGSSAPLQASGTPGIQYSWSPLQGLSCYNCPNPIATPLVTTPYIVQGTNSFGCTATDSVIVTVIQPLRLSVSPTDSICIGQSTNLLASGATSYSWSPAIGLNNTTISNPTAAPAVTTRYRVVGYDGFNCFTDTAYVLVAVGQYPTISLGPDLTLPTGTQHPLTSVVTNGPITSWLWSPSTDLSCTNCPLPVATIKKDITYSVKAANGYGCSASDTIHIKTFCESAQVFIPNAFTPNDDGHNDKLMVRASGIAMVKSFRIFNRWGEVVFEVGNCPPNDPRYGWDGKVKGKPAGPDVFVYTAEVVCDNGSTYPYKGNVTILK